MTDPALKERIEAHVKEFPGVISRDIAASLNISSQSVNMAVHLLQAEGKIHRIDHPSERRAAWEEGPAHDWSPASPLSANGQPRQFTVQSWQSTPAPRDPLLWALYGGQP